MTYNLVLTPPFSWLLGAGPGQSAGKVGPDLWPDSDDRNRSAADMCAGSLRRVRFAVAPW